jgi:DNA-binding transcriptional LysR family regulator
VQPMPACDVQNHHAGAASMERFEQMRLFAKVAETGSFVEAARQLNKSPPAVTRAIAALEADIGARLLTRTTRWTRLTEAGIRYHCDSRRILDDVAEADAMAGGFHGIPKGNLKVTTPIIFGRMYMVPILIEYLGAHPGVTASSLLLDRMVNLVEEGVDVAVRIGHLSDSSMTAIRVGSIRRVVCAAPSYLHKHGVPQKPADLVAHRIITSTSSFASLEWVFGPDQSSSIQVAPRLNFNTYDAIIQATLQGRGLARVLSYHIVTHLDSGALTTMLTAFEEPPLPVHVIHPEGRRASAKVRAFIDLAVARLRAEPHLNG